MLSLRIYNDIIGTRGATSAEYFLRAGYAVIFMHRQHSLQPFSRHYSHSTNPFLDFLEIEDSGSESELESGTKTASPRDEEGLEQVQKRRRLHHTHSSSKHSNQRIVVRTTDNPDLTHLQSVVSAYKSVKHQETLHMLTFVTINDYLWLLRAVSKVLSESVGRKAMYYLAAAVSDFFLPRSRLVSGSPYSLCLLPSVYLLNLIESNIRISIFMNEE